MWIRPDPEHTRYVLCDVGSTTHNIFYKVKPRRLLKTNFIARSKDPNSYQNALDSEHRFRQNFEIPWVC